MNAAGLGAGSEPGQSWSIGMASFCLTEPGQVEVERVGLRGSTGLEVQAFATKPGPPEFFFEQATLDSLGVGPGTGVSTACVANIDSEPSSDLTGVVSAVYVQLVRSGRETGRAEAVEVHWRSETDSGVIEVPIEVVLCDTAPCD